MRTSWTWTWGLDLEVHDAIAAELVRQQSTLEMIASENFAPPP